LLAAGVGSYLLFLLVNLPAVKLTGYLQQQYAPLAFHSVSGSLFSGSAARIEHEGVTAGPVRWRFRPSGLLKGRLQYRLQGRFLENPFHGNLAVGPGGDVRVHALEAELDPAGLVQAYSPVGFTTTGRMALRIDALELRDGFPVRLSGRLDWSGAGVTDPVSLLLGEVEVLLGSEAERITGQVSNDGDARVSGSLALSAARDYSVDLKVTPGAMTSAEVVEFLKTWGQSGPGGSYRLVDRGRL
jgi:general secretion pathway protein N